MTEEEKKAIEILTDEKNDYYYRFIDVRDSVKILLNLIQKQDTEINKLNNVIDRMSTFINSPFIISEECYCEYKNSNEDCCWKTDKECKDCIKEYFMKEEK